VAEVGALTKEWKGRLILDGASLVRICSVRDPPIIFFELHNKGIAHTNDIANQLVAWFDDASL
jgi:hypothetical protein